jgi:membrane-bound lytic murein transglycosylase D
VSTAALTIRRSSLAGPNAGRLACLVRGLLALLAAGLLAVAPARADESEAPTPGEAPEYSESTSETTGGGATTAAAGGTIAPSLPAPAGAPRAQGDTPAAAPAVAGPVQEGQRAESAAGEVAPASPKPEVGDVWERIRRGFAMRELTTKLADNRTRWYAGQPDYIGRMTARASLYLFHIVEEIERRGMPTELALLPFVESAMQPEAESHAKASGLWQFIPSTGKLYALEQNLWKDERRDVIESTRAALDYLQKLYDQFGDWHLALAAYNMGEHGLARAQERNRRAKKSIDYTSLRLPNETQYYVPKLQAIKNIVRDPARYDIELPKIRNEPYFVAVGKTRDIDVATAARLAEMPPDEFRALNPSFNRPIIVGAAQPQILLPADRKETFLSNLAAWEATGQPLASWTTHSLAAGDTLGKLAGRVGLTEAQLREANRIPPRYVVRPGSTILIPRDETMYDDIAPEMLSASWSLVPENANLRLITYRVRRGDTLQSVSRRWKVEPEEIIAWNRLRSDTLFAGQRLVLTVATARSAPAKKPAQTAQSKATTTAQSAARSAATAVGNIAPRR